MIRHRDVARSGTLRKIRHRDVAKSGTLRKIRHRDVEKSGTLLQICRGDIKALSVRAQMDTQYQITETFTSIDKQRETTMTRIYTLIN